uniref:adenine phosphoribosyltransferase n=1 Tax=Hyaloperonospora arabidopsidis (strain Emoy2) TaxID=559515 RepID=M4BZ34_HYAAE
MEIHQDAITSGDRVVIIDDLVASGKTLKVTVELVEQLGGHVVECGCVINSLQSTHRSKKEALSHCEPEG